MHRGMSVEEELRIITKGTAEVMLKKVMEIPDNLILRYFELVTDEHPDRIDEIRKQMENGRNPRDCKLELARIITGLYHDEEEMIGAEKYFHTVYQKGELPENMPVITAPEGSKSLMDLSPLLMKVGYVSSGSEFRRLIKQGGVQINQQKILDLDFDLKDLTHSDSNKVMKIGKKKFINI